MRLAVVTLAMASLFASFAAAAPQEAAKEPAGQTQTKTKAHKQKPKKSKHHKSEKQ